MAAASKNPLDADQVNLDDPAERQAFYEALIAQGAPLVREERLKAYCAGLIDEQGFVVDRAGLLSDVDAKLSVEQ